MHKIIFLRCFCKYLVKAKIWPLKKGPGVRPKHGPCQADNYMLKVNNRNTRTRCQICSKSIIKKQNNVIDAVLVSLLLTLNIFNTMLWGFYCQLWNCNCWLSIKHLWCNLVKGWRSYIYILELAFSWKLQVCLTIYDL